MNVVTLKQKIRQFDFLILEDDTLIGKLAQELLRLKGLSSVLCETPQEAFLELKKSSFAFLLLDLHLPEMKGIQVLDQMPEDLKVILISAATHFPEHPKVIGHIPKPFRLDDFFSTIRTLMSEENVCQRAS